MHKPSDFHEPAAQIAADDPHYFGNVLNARLSRRQTLLGGISAATTALLGGVSLAGCATDEDPAPGSVVGVTPKLNFTAIAKNLHDRVSLPAGYQASVLYAFGQPIAAGVPAYVGDGSETGASFAQRAGDHHDGMYYFGLGADDKLSPSENGRALMAMNHENITQTYLHAAGPTSSGGVRTEDEVIKEMNCHGVSVIEIKKDGAGKFALVPASAFNRRITTFTTMDLSGPVRGSKFAVTKFSTGGTQTRGTVNNCANGYTPWGTYLTCEENWNGYFKRAAGDAASVLRAPEDSAAFSRYTIPAGQAGNYGWTTVAGDDYQRWDASVTGTSFNGADDYRNVPQTFGYIVEIDPLLPASAPRKRTALGRFGHEGCWPARVTAGRPLVWYMGDDRAGDYVYKFVSDAKWDAADFGKGLAMGDKYMDKGTLYVAKYNADGTGSWIALVQGSNNLNADNALYPFATQAAVCVNTRLAADSVGATKMDRPEWCAVNPVNGEVYLTLTNNSSKSSTDAANPRRYTGGAAGGVPGSGGNINGHIIRWREDSDDPTATTFKWDIYLFGSRSGYSDAAVNASQLDATNDLSSPDGMWFDHNNLLWIQTDDGAYTDVTNCMMLAASPGSVGDGGAATLAGQATFKGKNPGADLRRFLVGPKQCELTGLTSSPDGKALFANIQHPGESGSFGTPSSNWPDPSGNALTGADDGTALGSRRPRSATIVITRTDGGVIGL